MKRTDFLQLETQLRLLIKKYQSTQKENGLMKAHISKLELDNEKKQKFISDLKLQLNDMALNKHSKSGDKNTEDIKLRVLGLIEDIDQCIKSIQ